MRKRSFSKLIRRLLFAAIIVVSAVACGPLPESVEVPGDTETSDAVQSASVDGGAAPVSCDQHNANPTAPPCADMGRLP